MVRTRASEKSAMVNKGCFLSALFIRMFRLSSLPASSFVLICCLTYIPSARAEFPALKVPAGFVSDVVASPGLVERPVMACFDDQGVLYVVDSAGSNDRFEDLVRNPPHRIVALKDLNGDGIFDERKLFADKLVMPQGVLPYRGAVYVASPPSVWKLEDTDGDGVCDHRTEIVTSFGSNGNAADIHGPFLGPDGWIYLCDGRHGHRVVLEDGTVDEELSGGIFRFRPDGTGFERVCGGGFDNPVEIDFLPSGEILGTVNLLYGNPRVDCFIHWIDGGVYPRTDQERCIAEFPWTGDLLYPMFEYGHVAVSGTFRFRGNHWGEEFRDNWFVCQFNRKKLQRMEVARKGATFSAKQFDFISSDAENVHFTDALQNPDGDLLLIDTGGWFRIGCPESQTAKPDILGRIYRIRKEGATPLDKIGSGSDLADLKSQNPHVAGRAIERLVAQGDRSFELLHSALEPSQDQEARVNAVYTLCRIGSESALSLLREHCLDQDETVRLAAIHCVGMHRDSRALPQLAETLLAESPSLKRQAAIAVSRIRFEGSSESSRTVAQNLLMLLKTADDRYLEHAVIHALLRVGPALQVQTPLRDLLSDSSSDVRRRTLIVLAQIPSDLSSSDVSKLLDTDDLMLRATAIKVISEKSGWSDAIVEQIRPLTREKNLSTDRLQMLRGVLIASVHEEVIQKLIAGALKIPDTPLPQRLVLWEAIHRHSSALLPEPIGPEVLRGLVDRNEPAEHQQIALVLVEKPFPEADEHLLRLARNQDSSRELRLALYEAAAPRLKQLEEGDFAFLQEMVQSEQPLDRLAAARILSRTPLLDEQRLVLADLIARSQPLEARVLLGSFRGGQDPNVARVLVDSLSKPTAPKVSAGTLKEILKSYPAESTEYAKPLLTQTSKKKLSEYLELLQGGEIRQGHAVFFGNKANCSQCHTVGGQGERVGPDLTNIGASRSGEDLLEAILLPNASFAREYQPVVVSTSAGLTESGIVSRETSDSLFLRKADLTVIRIKRSEIEGLREADVSIMPEGIEQTLTREELRDLLAYLQSLR